MNLAIKNSFNSNPTTFCENTLPPRTWVDQFGARIWVNSDALRALSSSDRTTLLNGDWDMCYFQKGLALKKNIIDFDKLKFNKVSLPNSLQSLNVEPFVYREDMPFDISLPFVKGDVPVVIFKKDFEVSDIFSKRYLTFTTISGAMEVYLNGEYVGYTELNSAEFDVSENILSGTNTLVVVMRKYSKASYLETGKKFDEFGILGDIVLRNSHKVSLFDYNYKSFRNEEGFGAKLDLNFTSTADCSVKIEIAKEKTIFYSDCKNIDNKDISFDIVGDFEGYTHSTPVEYDMYVTIIDKEGLVVECSYAKIAFCSYSMIKGSLSLNGKPIKLYGVSYNAQYNSDGSRLTLGKIKNDLELIKSYNFNCVKFDRNIEGRIINLCQSLGLYTIVDCGINTDGYNSKSKKSTIEKYVDFASLVKLKAEYAYATGKNNANNIFFSLGQENIVAPFLVEGKEFLKNSTFAPILGKDSQEIKCLYYPSMKELESALSVDSLVPVFMGLFAKVSGVGCAGLGEFCQIINNAPNCLGGAIGEFVDREVRGIGVVDNGLFNAKRQPYPSAENAKQVLCPLSAVYNGSMLTITNKDLFSSTGYIDIKVEVAKNGLTINQYIFKAKIPANGSKEYSIEVGHVDNDMYLNISYIKDDAVIGADQILLNTQFIQFDLPKGSRLSCYEYDKFLNIDFESGRIIFNKVLGKISSYSILGKNILKPDSMMKGINCFDNNFYRPFTRNIDKNEFYAEKLTDFDYVVTEEKIDVNMEHTYLLKKKEVYVVQEKYSIFANGKVEVFSALTPLKNTKKLPNLDCFGKIIKLHNQYGNITYYGKGATSNYVDMQKHAKMGIYNTDINHINNFYLMQQECGNYTNVYYATITDNSNDGIAIRAYSQPLEMKFSANSDKEILQAMKNKEKTLTQSGVYVSVNAFVSGIGTTENGEPVSKYNMKAGEYVNHFEIIPLNNIKW